MSSGAWDETERTQLVAACFITQYREERTGIGFLD